MTLFPLSPSWFTSGRQPHLDSIHLLPSPYKEPHSRSASAFSSCGVSVLSTWCLKVTANKIPVLSSGVLQTAGCLEQESWLMKFRNFVCLDAMLVLSVQPRSYPGCELRLLILRNRQLEWTQAAISDTHDSEQMEGCLTEQDRPEG